MWRSTRQRRRDATGPCASSPTCAVNSAPGSSSNAICAWPSNSGEFFLVYQPVVRLSDGAVQSVEALLRWRRPSGLVVAPDAFIPALEESGLIVEVGAFVLREACRQTRAVVRRRAADGGLGQRLAAPIRDGDTRRRDPVRAGELGARPDVVDPRDDRDDADRATRTSRRCASPALKDLGIRLAIDDFGTGYSSLAYLQQFPVDILKIDRTFVATATDRASTALIHALIELGSALGLKTVAEGIETADQLMRLKREGCDAGQGFYFSRPLEVADAQHFLATAGNGVAVASGAVSL